MTVALTYAVVCALCLMIKTAWCALLAPATTLRCTPCDQGRGRMVCHGQWPARGQHAQNDYKGHFADPRSWPVSNTLPLLQIVPPVCLQASPSRVCSILHLCLRRSPSSPHPEACGILHLCLHRPPPLTCSSLSFLSQARPQRHARHMQHPIPTLAACKHAGFSHAHTHACMHACKAPHLAWANPTHTGSQQHIMPLPTQGELQSPHA